MPRNSASNVQSALHVCAKFTKESREQAGQLPDIYSDELPASLVARLLINYQLIISLNTNLLNLRLHVKSRHADV